jgi:hypothetical protein
LHGTKTRCGIGCGIAVRVVLGGLLAKRLFDVGQRGIAAKA